MFSYTHSPDISYISSLGPGATYNASTRHTPRAYHGSLGAVLLQYQPTNILLALHLTLHIHSLNNI